MIIEESNNLYDMKREELKSSLEAHDMRLKQINSDRVTKQALQTKFFKKMKDEASKIKINK